MLCRPYVRHWLRSYSRLPRAGRAFARRQESSHRSTWSAFFSRLDEMRALPGGQRRMVAPSHARPSISIAIHPGSPWAGGCARQEIVLWQ